jgi:hypothetical protein
VGTVVVEKRTQSRVEHWVAQWHKNLWRAPMSDDRPKRDTMSIEEAAISDMWEISKQDLYDIIAEFRRKNPRARIPETAFPEPYLLTETENKIMDDILSLLNQHGLTSHQSQNLLERLGRIIEMGQRVAKGTTH